MSDNTTTGAIVMEREFDAPMDLVWQMWTDAEHFKNWYGPNGFTIPVAEMDVRVGGKNLICMEMQTPNGSMRMWTTGEYTEVVPIERLVYTDSAADEHGNIVEPGSGGGHHPPVTQVTVQLEDLGGRTKMVVTHAGLPPEAQGASGGWNQAFGKMADYLATMS